MFKKRERKGAGRKREREPVAADAGDGGGASTASAGGGGEGEDDGHATIYRKEAKPKRGARFDTRGEDDGDSDDERMQGAAVFASTRTVEAIEHRGGAFASAEIDADASNDARAILERAYAAQRAGETNDDTKLYTGAANYKSYVAIDEARIGGNKYSGTKGPIRAPQFVRNTCRFDYQPDVCKDYKDTGFCGYGDSCKFAHDRGDYKTGWQLEAEWQRQKEKKKAREMLGKFGEDSDEERERDKFRVGTNDDDLPFACHLCRGAFRDPMRTTCDHYFCANCAQAHFRDKSTRCPICEKQTYGMLNAAPKLRAKAKAAGGFEELLQSSLVVDAEEEADDYAGSEKPGKYGAPDQAPGAAKPTPESMRATIPSGSWASVDPRNL